MILFKPTIRMSKEDFNKEDVQDCFIKQTRNDCTIKDIRIIILDHNQGNGTDIIVNKIDSFGIIPYSYIISIPDKSKLSEFIVSHRDSLDINPVPDLIHGQKQKENIESIKLMQDFIYGKSVHKSINIDDYSYIIDNGILLSGRDKDNTLLYRITLTSEVKMYNLHKFKQVIRYLTTNIE